MTDIIVILNFHGDKNPFIPDPNIQNIVNGLSGDATVNVDKAEIIGEHILESMNGRRFAEYTFKKKEEAVTLGM